MQEQTKGIIFLLAIPFIEIFFVIISILYAKNFPDPLNAIAIILLNFGPISLMLWYWISRFYFARKENKGIGG